MLEITEEMYLLLIRRATGKSIEGDSRFDAEPADEKRYPELRALLKADDSTKGVLPPFVNTYRTLDDFWQFIKKQSPTYQGRKELLAESFAPLFAHLEDGALNNAIATTPLAELATEALSEFGFDSVTRLWQKTLSRFQADDDHDGAITTARSTIESVCKHIMSERAETYNSNDTMPNLVKHTINVLDFTTDTDTLSGLKEIAIGIAKLRNANGDSHGIAPGASLPSKVLTEFVIHQAATLCWLLLKEHKAKAM